MPQDDTSDLARALNRLATLLAYQIAGSMTVAEGAPLLDRLGMDSSQIAKVLDTTPNAVNARIGEAKRKKR